MCTVCLTRGDGGGVGERERHRGEQRGLFKHVSSLIVGPIFYRRDLSTFSSCQCEAWGIKAIQDSQIISTTNVLGWKIAKLMSGLSAKPQTFYICLS